VHISTGALPINIILSYYYLILSLISSLFYSLSLSITNCQTAKAEFYADVRKFARKFKYIFRNP